MTHSDPKDLIYADRIRWAWREAGGGYLEGPLELSVAAYFQRPKSHTSPRTLEYTTAGLVDEWVTKKPDLSNIIKAVEDSLNGLAFSDDSKIVRYGEVFKKWAPSQSDGWLEVKISEMEL